MNRYNKSILGLMEQCEDGEWVRYTEACYEMRQVEFKNDNLQTQLHYRDLQERLSDDLENMNDHLFKTVNRQSSLIMMLSISLLGATVLLLNLITRLP